MRKVYFVTSNKKKFEEVKELFKKENIEIKHVELEPIEPKFENIEEISKYKAIFSYYLIRKPVIVEDSGLFIESLNGFPGVNSKFVYNTIGLNGILKLLEGLENRKAYFKCVFTYFDGNIIKSFEGVVEGFISKKVKGDKGFGYDPIFIPKGYEETFAENYELKLKISHRRKAVEKLIKFLKNGNFT